MPEEIIEETPVEETPVEETPTEEAPVEEPTPAPTVNSITFGRVMNVPDEMLNYLAEYIYPETVPKEPHELPPGDTIFSIEERYKPNPMPKLEWMQNWFDESMVELFMTRFTNEVNAATNADIQAYSAQKRAEAQAMIDAKREQIKSLIVRV